MIVLPAGRGCPRTNLRCVGRTQHPGAGRRRGPWTVPQIPFRVCARRDARTAGGV